MGSALTVNQSLNPELGKTSPYFLSGLDQGV